MININTSWINQNCLKEQNIVKPESKSYFPNPKFTIRQDWHYNTWPSLTFHDLFHDLPLFCLFHCSPELDTMDSESSYNVMSVVWTVGSWYHHSLSLTKDTISNSRWPFKMLDNCGSRTPDCCAVVKLRTPTQVSGMHLSLDCNSLPFTMYHCTALLCALTDQSTTLLCCWLKLKVMN